MLRFLSSLRPFLRLTFLFLAVCIFISGSQAQNYHFTVVLDAGHGGHDAGALGTVINEKDINLGVVRALGAIIDQNLNDVKVIYTRKTDVFIPLQERADIANRNKADLFISVHTNSSTGSSAYGAEVYTLGLAKSKSNLNVAMTENSVMLLEDDYKTRYQGFNPSSVESYIMFEFMQDKYLDRSIQFATLVQNNFINGVKRFDRGVRQAGFWVLHRSACPSVLVELGFISNRSEENFLSTDMGQKKMAWAIYNALLKYKYDFDKRSGNAIINAKKQIDDSNKNFSVENMPEINIKEQADTAKTIIKSVPEVKPESVQVVNQQVAPVKPIEKTKQITAATSDEQVKSMSPVYKIQFYASPDKLKKESSKLKGVQDYEVYTEGGLFKYTVGKVSDYKEILKIKKDINQKFPDAFIIAFLGDKKIPVSEARKINP